ncbi:MAG: TIGR01777 family oxidoreductase [Propionibacteriaceae bacterium]
MRVLLSGASGFLGTALRVRFAQQGHEVVRLVRRAPAAGTEFRWDPSRRQLDAAAFDGVDAVINLSGAGIADQPWTEKRRAVLLSSRVDSTATLAEGLAAYALASGTSPTLLQASGIAWYGTTSGPAPHREGEPAASDWLAQVCVQWEGAAGPAVDAGLRVAYLRTTPVLDRSGGTLKLLKLPFSVGLGAKLGDGTQHMAMIGLEDWLRAVDWLLATATASGPYNLTIPEPSTNAEFTTALARALHRPVFLAAPAAVLGLVGELAQQLLGDQHVIPAALTDAGFVFEAPDVATTVAHALD